MNEALPILKVYFICYATFIKKKWSFDCCNNICHFDAVDPPEDGSDHWETAI